MDGLKMYDSLIDPPLEVEVEFELTVRCDGEKIYSSTFGSEEALEEEGLRKAAHAIEHYTRTKEEEDLEEDYA